MLIYVLTLISLALLAPLAAMAQTAAPRVVISEAGAVGGAATLERHRSCGRVRTDCRTPRAIIRNITLKDIDVTLENPKVTIEKVEGLRIENVNINGVPLSPGK